MGSENVSEGQVIKGYLESDFNILKSDDLIIGGYASIEVVDKQNDLITLQALNEAVQKYMGEKKYRNVMSNHSNVQVGEVIEKYRDKHGMLHKTHVDDVGFYVVIKLRDDIEKAKEISRGIRKGTLRSFSIGGQALSKKQRSSEELGEYNEIDKLELHEVTICEKGINPEARFDILKEERNDMTEKLEKALEELNGLMKEVNTMKKGEDDLEELKNEYADFNEEAEEEPLMEEGSPELEEELELSENLEEEIEASDFDTAQKGRKWPGGDYVETGFGEDPMAGKKHTQAGQVGQLYKEWQNEDFATLDLSTENVEKAYEAFKAEQLEKMAYDSLKTSFADRFASEQEVRKASVARTEYNAKNEVEALKEEFATLRKSLQEQEATIIKSQEIALPDIDVSEMSWNEIHNYVNSIKE